MSLDTVTSWLYSIVQNYGVAGAFVVSVLGNVIPFIPVPYILAVLWLSVVIDPLVLGFTSGLGAAIGKILIYYVGYSSRSVLSEERKKKLEFAKKILDRFGPIAIFLFAVTPSPDDMLYFPLGMVSYNPAKFFVFCFLGKVVMTLGVAYAGRYSIGGLVELFTSQGGAIGVVATLAFVVISIYVTIKVDWERIFVRYLSKKDDSFNKLSED